MTIVVILSVVFCIVLGQSVYSARCRTERNAKIGWAALPIRQLRQDVIALQSRNRQRTQWCALVDSAKPDDSVLQTVAGIAMTLQPADHDILIDRLHLRLPVEIASSDDSREWSLPLLSIDLRSKNSVAQRRWLDQIEQLDRIERLAFDSQETTAGDSSRFGPNGLQRLQLNATPVATRVLP